MIRQHVYCWNDERFGTAAISPGPEGSISQDRLEQAVRLCAASNALPVYFQYPLDGGVVVGRCGVAEENGEERAPQRGGNDQGKQLEETHRRRLIRPKAGLWEQEETSCTILYHDDVAATLECAGRLVGLWLWRSFENHLRKF